MKYLLYFPPIWTPTQPYLSLPSLTAYLKKMGSEVIQRDMNLEFFYWLCSSKTVSDIYSSIEGNDKYRDNEDIKTILNVLKEKLIDSGETYLENLKDKNLFFSNNPIKYKESLNMFNYMLKLISFKYYPQVLTSFNYSLGTEDIHNSKDLIDILDDFEKNLFTDFFDQMIEKTNYENIDIVGISIIGKEQLIPGLLLSKLIKMRHPEIKICVGGPIISRLKDTIMNNSNFFRLFDFAILYEGEYPLYSLGLAVSNKISIDKVPNLLYYDGNSIKYTYDVKGLDISEIPTPDFDGLALDKYLSPEISLPVLTSRGCYWNRCTFCDHSFIYNSNFRLRKIDDLLNDLKILKNKYNTVYFNFVDECVPPKTFKLLVENLPKLPFKIFWYCDLRFEKDFINKQLFVKAYESGLRTIFFGFESGSQKVLDLMDKGTSIRKIENILKASSDAGVWNHLFGIYGFPSEEQEDFVKTKKFLLRNIDHIHSIGFSRFSLNKFSKITLNPLKYGIEKVNLRGDLSIDLEYFSNVGLHEKYLDEMELKNKKIGFPIKTRYDNFTQIYHRDLWYIYLSKSTPQAIIELFHKESNKDYSINQKAKIRLNKSMIYKKENSLIAIIDIYSAKYYEFTSSVGLIFDLIKDEISLTKLISELESKININKVIEEELILFLEQLRRKNIIDVY